MKKLTGTDYRVDIVHSLEAWERLAGPWNELLKSSRADAVFLSFEWLYSWAECFLQGSRELYILTVYREEELLGIAPWYRNPVSANGVSLRQLEFLGSPEAGSDYLDVIIKGGKEQEVTACLYRFLLDQGRDLWDSLLLRDIPSDSLFLLYLQEKIESEGKYAELCKGSYCPVATLQKNGDWMPAGVSSGRRARFKQDLGRLEKSGKLNHDVVSGHALDAGLNDFFSFYSDKTGHDGLALHSFLKKFASRASHLLQLDFLSLESRSIAAFLHLRYRNELMLYLMAVDKAYNPKISAGNVLVGLSIKQACECGMERYDFLKGNERYKFSWADSGRTSLSFIFCRKKLKPILFTTARFAKYVGKMVLR